MVKVTNVKEDNMRGRGLIRQQIGNLLTQEYTHDTDIPWQSSFYSWDKGDCSEMGLVLCYVEYLLHTCDHGEKDDWIEKVETWRRGV